MDEVIDCPKGQRCDAATSRIWTIEGVNEYGRVTALMIFMVDRSVTSVNVQRQREDPASDVGVLGHVLHSLLTSCN